MFLILCTFTWSLRTEAFNILDNILFRIQITFAEPLEIYANNEPQIGKNVHDNKWIIMVTLVALNLCSLRLILLLRLVYLSRLDKETGCLHETNRQQDSFMSASVIYLSILFYWSQIWVTGPL